MSPQTGSQSVLVTPYTTEGSISGWTPIFDGRTLKGWGTYGGSLESNPEDWRVVDDAIVGDGSLSHLYYAKEQFTDFELQADVKVNEGGNSGIYFRAQMLPGFPAGYEAQVNNTYHGDPVRTGSLIGFQSITEQLMSDDVWFRMNIRAEQNRIQIFLNRQQVVDYFDPANTYSKGYFALQQHGEGTIIRFRNLMVRHLA
jgi:hypothetical protein